MNLFRIVALAVALFVGCTPTFAQWQTPTHSVPVGQGAGKTGFGSAAPGTAGQALISNGPNADPTFQSLAAGFVTPVRATTARLIATIFGDRLTVKDFGALGNGTANDTAGMQAMIDASCPGHLTGPVNQIFPVQMPAGTYMVSQLNATHCVGFTMWGEGTGAPSGAGVAGVAIVKIPGTAVNAVLDMTGSVAGFNLKNFWVQASYGAGPTDTPYPNEGILIATSTLTENTGNFGVMEGVSVSGRFVQAPLYIYGVCCSASSMQGMTNFSSPASTYTAAWILTQDNIGGAVSSFATIDNTTQGVSNWQCNRCESHAFTSDATGSGQALVLNGARGFSYTDGIFAAANGFIVQLVGNNSSVKFDNDVFYTDQGPAATFAVGSTSGRDTGLTFITPDVTVGAGGKLFSIAGFNSGRVIGGVMNAGGVAINFHDGAFGTPPTASVGTVTGADGNGKVTSAAASTGSVITFAVPFNNANPTCTASTNLPVSLNYSANSTALTMTWTSTANVIASWDCRDTFP